MNSSSLQPPFWLARAWEVGGIATMVLGIVGSLVVLIGLNGWVNDLNATLGVTTQAVNAADQTVGVVEDALGIVRDVMASADGVIGQTSQTLGDVSSMTASIVRLMNEDLPDQIGAVRSAMDGLTTTAGIIDGVLSAGSFFGLDYDPAVPFDDALRDVDKELGELPMILEKEADNLLAVGRSIVDLDTEVGSLSRDISRLGLEIGDAQTLIAEYRSTAAEANVVVTEASDSLRSQAWLIRILVVVGGLCLAALGSRLWWVGKSRSDG